MPAGDLIAADWQLELRATLMGAGTSFRFQPASIKGLGVPAVKSADVELSHEAGAYGSPDYQGIRILTVPLWVLGATDAAALNNLAVLNTAWAPSTTDIPLYLRMPGWGKFYLSGRPRGLDDDLVMLKSGVIACLATFAALNPTITYVT